jgi:hypothetical protein
MFPVGRERGRAVPEALLRRRAQGRIEYARQR